MEALGPSEMLLPFYETMQHLIRGNHNLHTHQCENLNSSYRTNIYLAPLFDVFQSWMFDESCDI